MGQLGSLARGTCQNSTLAVFKQFPFGQKIRRAEVLYFHTYLEQFSMMHNSLPTVGSNMAIPQISEQKLSKTGFDNLAPPFRLAGPPETFGVDLRPTWCSPQSLGSSGCTISHIESLDICDISEISEQKLINPHFVVLLVQKLTKLCCCVPGSKEQTPSFILHPGSSESVGYWWRTVNFKFFQALDFSWFNI